MNNNLQQNQHKQKQTDAASPDADHQSNNADHPRKHKAVVIAIASGCGGVGKSTIAVNIAIAMARASSRVCVFDAGADSARDSGGVSASGLLGVNSRFSYNSFFKARRPSASLLPAGPEGVRVFPAAAKLTHFLQPHVSGQRKIADGLEALENDCDYFILDLHSDRTPGTLQLASAAQILLIVITPEPKSLSQAFLLLRTLRQTTRSEIIVQVVINFAENAKSAAGIYRCFSDTVKKYLHIQTEFLGSVWIDGQLSRPTFGRWLAAQMPITEPVCRTFFRLARRLTEIAEQKKLPKISFSSYWHIAPSRSVDSSSPKPVDFLVSPSTLNAESVGGEADAAFAGFDINRRRIERSKIAQKQLQEDKVWRQFRTRLSRFLLNRRDRAHYIADLLTVCFELKGRAATPHSFTEPVLGLLGELSPGHLNAEQRSRLSRLAKNLLGDSYQVVTQSTVETPEAHPEYDSEGFGEQQVLLQKLRESSSAQSLNSLLDAIKYASKVNVLDS